MNFFKKLFAKAEPKEEPQKWKKVQYSAILDEETCPACREADGTIGETSYDLPPAPNPRCDASDGYCRCMHVLHLRN